MALVVQMLYHIIRNLSQESGDFFHGDVNKFLDDVS